MTTIAWFFAIGCVVLLLMVVDLLHVRMTGQQTEIAFDHAKARRGIKQAFATCKSWFRRKRSSGESDESHDEDASDKIHSMRA